MFVRFNQLVRKTTVTTGLTLNNPGPVGAQHDIHHQDELRRTLAERLEQAEHAQVVREVDGILRALLLPPPHPETLPDG